MKRITALLVFVLVLAFASASFGAAVGSCTVKLDKYPIANMRVLTYSWIGSVDDGSVPSTTTSAAIIADIAGWYVYAIETNPGSVAPTTLYDIVVNDVEGLDIAGGMLADRSATATQKITPRLDSTYSIFGGVLIDGALTLVIINQAVHSATGTVKLLLAK